MSDFKTLDPDEILRLLEGHQDLLGPMVEKENAMFRHSPCPLCGSLQNDTFVNPNNPFSPGSPLPNRLMRCRNCSTEFDPYTGLMYKVIGERD